MLDCVTCKSDKSVTPLKEGKARAGITPKGFAYFYSEMEIKYLRQKTVPEGYTINPWTEGLPFKKAVYLCTYIHPLGLTESQDDELRSVLAQAHYTHVIWQEKGFQTHCYVPEVEGLPGKVFHERKDHAHLLKINYNQIHIFKEKSLNNRELPLLPERVAMRTSNLKDLRRQWKTQHLLSLCQH